MRLPAFLCVGVMLFAACNEPEPTKPAHYFLQGYDELEFWDSTGAKVPATDFISATQINGVRAYQVVDTTLTLMNRRTGEAYTGYIRTFHKHLYNIEARFTSGKIQRMRFWYGDRTLGMDANFAEQTGTIWNRAGQTAVSWNAKESYYLQPSTQTIRQIISDTLTSFFDAQGDLDRYTIRSDSGIIQYYADGTPRFQFPITPNGIRNGPVKRWHPNGQLQVTGQYKNGRQYGLWIEYDSLGNEIKREVWE